jgi:glycosyltransferase involved in cell wall biosynthesis
VGSRPPCARPRVAFVQLDPPSTFTEIDRELLEEAVDLEILTYRGRNDVTWVKDCIHAVRRADAVYAFFASEHAAIPFAVGWLLRKRLVLIPGGYDYAFVPERRYGLRANGRGWLPWILGRVATVALPISDQTRWEFLDLVPSAAPRTMLLHLALDPRAWPDEQVRREPDQIVTVGFIDEEAYSRKGIDRFVALARRDRGRTYVLGGAIESSVRLRIERDRPPNLRLTGRLTQPELTRLLRSSTVYVQLSWHETFGVAMAEAMLCGCVPVISRSPALGEVAGRWAVVSDGPGVDLTAVDHAVERAANRAMLEEMSADVVDRFALERRRGLLIDAVLGRGEVG